MPVLGQVQNAYKSQQPEVRLASSTRYGWPEKKVDTQRVATAIKMTRFVQEFMNVMYKRRRTRTS